MYLAKRSILIFCEGLACNGAVATVAWKQALGLSEFQRVHLVSDGFSAARLDEATRRNGSLSLECLRRTRFRFLHRLSHLPSEFAWLYLLLGSTARYLKQEACHPQVENRHPAVIVCHSHPVAALLRRWFGKRVRIVMVSHGDIFHRPAGSYDPGMTWLYRRTTGAAHRGASLNVALSPEMRSRILAHGTPSASIALIPNGVEATDIGLEATPRTSISHWSSKPFKILYVGRIELVKGIDLLIKAAALLNEKYVDFKLDIIGGASRAAHVMLENSIKENHLTNMVRVVGSISRNALAAHYLEAHVVVVPSRDDPLPTVVLEAMACGRPVVGADTGGLRFLIEHGRSGLLVPVNDAEGLAQALLQLHQHREALAPMGEVALSKVSAFTWKSNVDALQNCLEDLFHEPGRNLPGGVDLRQHGAPNVQDAVGQRPTG